MTPPSGSQGQTFSLASNRRATADINLSDVGDNKNYSRLWRFLHSTSTLDPYTIRTRFIYFAAKGTHR